MNKSYSRINWENYSSEKTPLNSQNLNKMDVSIDEVDTRVVTLDETKATKVEISTLFSEVSYDIQTGIITFTRRNGATVTIDTPMEKIALNIYYDPVTEMLTLPLIDGTRMEVDLSRLITEYEFLDSDTIAFSIKPDGKVTAIVKKGSIMEEHLRPDYLADIKVESAKAEASKNAAEASAKESESWAHGGTGTREGEDENNSRFWSQQSKSSSETSKSYLEKVEKAGEDAVDAINGAMDVAAPKFVVDLTTGHLLYSGIRFIFLVNEKGHLNWGLAV